MKSWQLIKRGLFLGPREAGAACVQVQQGAYAVQRSIGAVVRTDPFRLGLPPGVLDGLASES